jgi:AAA ATPase domain
MVEAPAGAHAGVCALGPHLASFSGVLKTCRVPVLRDRHGECEALDGLLEAVRAGESRALVVRGEPGIGKTALLEYVRERASGCRVARAAGSSPSPSLCSLGSLSFPPTTGRTHERTSERGSVSNTDRELRTPA